MRTVRLSVEPSLVATAYPFHHRIRVRFAETDAMGIVHHSRYLLYMEETRSNICATSGIRMRNCARKVSTTRSSSASCSTGNHCGSTTWSTYT